MLSSYTEETMILCCLIQAHNLGTPNLEAFELDLSNPITQNFNFWNFVKYKSATIQIHKNLMFSVIERKCRLHAIQYCLEMPNFTISQICPEPTSGEITVKHFVCDNFSRLNPEARSSKFTDKLTCIHHLFWYSQSANN